MNRLNTLGPSAKIFKVDISRAFRHFTIDPGDIDLLGLCHRDKYYLNLALPFGSFFNAVRCIMSKHGHTALFNYIDDLLYYDLSSKIQGPYEYVVSLLQELGLTISDKN